MQNIVVLPDSLLGETHEHPVEKTICENRFFIITNSQFAINTIYKNLTFNNHIL